MRFSIVIPTWEINGQGSYFLNQLLLSIKDQDYKDLEIIISDHSVDDSIKDLVSSHKDLNINYLKNENNRGNSPANLNFALKHAKGEIIKIMFQDDFFVKNNSLKLIDEQFSIETTKWLVNGSCDTTDSVNFYNFITPVWSDNIIEGRNTIGSPSVLSMLNNDIDFFDENLTMLMDCDYYFLLYKKYGPPCVLQDCLIANTSHSNQISKNYKKNLKEEINITKNKNYEFRK